MFPHQCYYLLCEENTITFTVAPNERDISFIVLIIIFLDSIENVYKYLICKRVIWILTLTYIYIKHILLLYIYTRMRWSLTENIIYLNIFNTYVCISVPAILCNCKTSKLILINDMLLVTGYINLVYAVAFSLVCYSFPYFLIDFFYFFIGFFSIYSLYINNY